MRNRGKVYWEWANPEMYFRNYDERLTCGTLINIQARLSPENATQLFLGIYGEKGVLLLEELHPNCSDCLGDRACSRLGRTGVSGAKSTRA
ncbi:hypothetical protein Q7L29_00795 [Pseudomonas putida]|uniref:hypothetical protein n=1 Tax=Pseudomonas TaxID=286 RepID=UPI0021BDA239|nr:hypothetical protein [Pseudomonas putida]MDP9537070.1 hypothetical protein [Pseudomonas putida]